jgi:hypothetical protein
MPKKAVTIAPNAKVKIKSSLRNAKILNQMPSLGTHESQLSAEPNRLLNKFNSNAKKRHINQRQRDEAQSENCYLIERAM